MKPLRNAMRNEAGWVWREKARAELLGLSLNEETITEMMLFHLSMAAQGSPFKIVAFTKAQETKIGADWEFWFASASKIAGLRVQAKRLFKSGRYDSLSPRSKQTTDLIGQAGSSMPVFAFYNDAKYFTHSSPDCACNEYRAQSYRGCLVALATMVERAATIDPKIISQFAIPMHCLLCERMHENAMSLPEVVLTNIQHRLGGEGKVEEIADPPMRDHILGLVATSGEDDSSAQDWFEGYLKERRLAGLALFTVRTLAFP